MNRNDRISEAQVDRLSDELNAMATAANNAILADALRELAIDRSACVDFAIMLKNHDNPSSALAELLNAR